ncbi:hypothetical protein THAOC_03404, partial [Thalassiosira oceanica]
RDASTVQLIGEVKIVKQLIKAVHPAGISHGTTLTAAMTWPRAAVVAISIIPTTSSALVSAIKRTTATILNTTRMNLIAACYGGGHTRIIEIVERFAAISREEYHQGRIGVFSANFGGDPDCVLGLAVGIQWIALILEMNVSVVAKLTGVAINDGQCVLHFEGVARVLRSRSIELEVGGRARGGKRHALGVRSETSARAHSVMSAGLLYVSQAARTSPTGGRRQAAADATALAARLAWLESAHQSKSIRLTITYLYYLLGSQAEIRGHTKISTRSPTKQVKLFSLHKGLPRRGHRRLFQQRLGGGPGPLRERRRTFSAPVRRACWCAA